MLTKKEINYLAGAVLDVKNAAKHSPTQDGYLQAIGAAHMMAQAIASLIKDPEQAREFCVKVGIR